LVLVLVDFHRFICQRVERPAVTVGMVAGCRRFAVVAVATVGEVGPGCPGFRPVAVHSDRSVIPLHLLLAPESLAVVRILERSVPARSADLAD